MLGRKFVIGCLLIVAGIAWPTTTIVSGLTKFSQVYRSAASEHHPIRPAEKSEVISSVEQGISSILGGVVISLFGVALALESARNRQESSTATAPAPAGR